MPIHMERRRANDKTPKREKKVRWKATQCGAMWCLGERLKDPGWDWNLHESRHIESPQCATVD